MTDLAIQYVLLTEPTGAGPSLCDESWDLHQEMLRRAGLEHTETHIRQARETYQMIHGPSFKIKWMVGFAIKTPGTKHDSQIPGTSVHT